LLDIVNLLKDGTVYDYQRAGLRVADILSGLADECKLFNLLGLAKDSSEL